jgi:hypothetical protein
VWSRNLVNEEALAHWGAVAPKTNKVCRNVHEQMHLVHAQRILFLTVRVPKVAHGSFVSKQHSADIFRVNPNTCRDPGTPQYARTR